MLRKLATAVLGATIAVVISTKARPETVTIEEYIGETIENSVTDAFQKAAELAEAKVASNAEFNNAWLAFYAQLESGVLGSPEEQRFALLLYQKDIYYLSLYAAEGVYAGAKRIRAVDALSGGHALDGGIDSFAKDLFQVWVNDVRAILGAKHDGELIMAPSPAQFMQAIVDTSDSYNRYRKARDRLELLRWRASRPLIYAPKATTPETRADTYIRVVLDPTIDKELAKIPAEQRDAAKQTLNDWVMTLREAIIEFETISLTPEDVTEVMKSLDFSEQDMAYFWSRLGDRKELQGNDFLVAVDQALAQTQNFRDLRQHGRQFDSQPASWDTQLKTWKLKQSGKLNYRELYNTQPVKFARVTYHEVAHAIADGSLGSESPLPVFRRYGAAYQPQPNAASAPAFPETKSEPERLLPAVEADKSAFAEPAPATDVPQPSPARETASSIRSNLEGANVRIGVYCCTGVDSGNLISNVVTGLAPHEFDKGSLQTTGGLSIIPVAINVEPSRIVIRYPDGGRFGVGPFNGYHFAFSGVAPITSVTVDPLSTFRPGSISFTSDSVDVNVSGQTTGDGTQAILQIFQDAAPYTSPEIANRLKDGQPQASAQTGSAEHECDILAASAYDLSRPAGVPGIEFEKIDAARAEAACQRAIREHPSPRLFAQLGRAFDAGHNDAEALANYRVAADQGSPVGQFYLGFMYATGEGIAMDAGQAVSWYRKAAGQGFAPGQNALGAMYDNGDGVSKDAGQAAFWYRKAAEQGYPPGECNLGSQYYNGTGVAKDAAQAVFWYRKAAEHGVADAQFNLALSYQDGAGVAKDDSQAAFWHRKAAEQGYAKAENNLGALYYNAGDVDEAIFWLQKAADQGIAEAQSNLALAYRQRVPSANSFPSAGRNSSDELVDQMRTDQRQRDRENADAERRGWEETNRRQMEDIRRGQELYNQQHQ